MAGRGVLRRAAARALPERAKPPLGEAEPQYAPRPLTVPRGYSSIAAPVPAPVISIVTPSLNQSRFLGAAMDSVLDQGYPELQYVLMDGGSQDESLAEIEARADRLHHRAAGPDAGQAAAINAGFACTEGALMGWLNADDLLLPGALAYVGRYFARHPAVDMVYGHRVLLDESGRDVGLWVTPAHREDSLRWFDFVPQETAFWRRELWERVGGIDDSISVAFDWDLFMRFAAVSAPIVRLPRFLGAHRIHAAQRTRVHADDALIELAAIRDRHHGRSVSLEEAKSSADSVRARSVPLYLAHRLRARGSRGRVPVFPA